MKTLKYLILALVISAGFSSCVVSDKAHRGYGYDRHHGHDRDRDHGHGHGRYDSNHW